MQEIDDVSSEFKAWACSLSGCDGGDPSAPIWLSGIEWGYAKDTKQSPAEYNARLKTYYQEDLPREIASGPVEPAGTYDWKDSFAYGFGRSVAKLYAAIRGKDVGSYPKLLEMFPDARLLKLNLYPIAFPNTDTNWWEVYNLERVTGLPSARAYRGWCCVNRFPMIAAEVRARQPRLIIGVGISYLTEFLLCFSGSGGSGAVHDEEIKVSDAPGGSRNFYWTRVNDGRTTVAVIPFLSGRHGLNSDALIGALGGRLGKLCSFT